MARNSNTPGASRSPWPGVLAAGLDAGAAVVALECFARARAGRRERPPVPAERIAEAVPAREPRALAYTHTQYTTLALGQALSLAFLVAANRHGRTVRLRRWAGQIARRPFLRDALFAGALTSLYSAVTLPFSFAAGYLVERAFGLSTQGPGGWLADSLKAFGISLALGAPSTAGLFLFIRRAPQRWWLWAGGASALLSAVLANLAPILIDPLFFRFTPLRDEELRRRLTDLAARAGISVLGVFEADYSRKTKKANAYLTGVANTRRIVLTDTLLAGYSHDEIAVVLAHELGHHRFGHIWKAMVLGTVGTLVGFLLADSSLERAGARPGHEGKADVANLPALALFLSIIGLPAMPAGTALSRCWERQCDRFALEMTGDPEAFIGVMRKLSQQNLSDPAPPAWIEVLLYDHPSIRNRILMALEGEA